MIVVLDVNIILSALIKDSTTRNIIVNSAFDFCFPESAFQKIRKYKELILQKSDLSGLEYLTILNTLFEFIRIIPEEEILKNWQEAKEIMEHIDPEDVAFIATSLSQEDAAIWSDDAHFDRQDRVVNLKTKDMVALFEKNSM